MHKQSVIFFNWCLAETGARGSGQSAGLGALIGSYGCRCRLRARTLHGEALCRSKHPCVPFRRFDAVIGGLEVVLCFIFVAVVVGLAGGRMTAAGLDG